jgi:hypothetical protein
MFGERVTATQALSLAAAELRDAARAAGVIADDERIAYTTGSRTYHIAPSVHITGPRGDRPLLGLPDFTRMTRSRDVAVAMMTMATHLRHLVDLQVLWANP